MSPVTSRTPRYVCCVSKSYSRDLPDPERIDLDEFYRLIGLHESEKFKKEEEQASASSFHDRVSQASQHPCSENAIAECVTLHEMDSLISHSHFRDLFLERF